MANHHSIDLELNTDKPGNVYRYIYSWRPILSGHGQNIYYLLLHAIVQWGPDRDQPVKAFSIAMQYSSTPGHNADISQPPHILESDIDLVLKEFEAFREQCNKTDENG